MQMDRHHLEALFAKYLEDECTPEEMQILVTYFESKDHEGNIRELVRQEFSRQIPVGQISTDEVDRIHRHFEEIIRKSKSRHRSWAPSPRVWLQTAASWLLLIAGIVTALYFYRSAYGDNGMTETATRPGEQKKLVLSDGSVVWLNAASKIYYPQKFKAGKREVTLEGEAFFEINRDTLRPFVIYSGGLNTTVLGTSFNVKAYKEDKTLSIAVLTGQVKVSSPETELHLHPDQQAVFDKKTNTLDKKAISFASELSSWKEGMFRFRNTTFSEVTAALQRSYNVKITFDPSLENCPIIHADFNNGESVESILKTLMISVNGEVKETGNRHYRLSSTATCTSPEKTFH